MRLDDQSAFGPRFPDDQSALGPRIIVHGRVLDELSALGGVIEVLSEELGTRIDRLGGYGPRFKGALARVRRGELSWVDRVKEDSCHTVWMELHEDLLATLGITRGEEPAARA